MPPELGGEQAPATVVQPVGERRNAKAAGRGLLLGRPRVVGHAQELDAPGVAIENGALGELVCALALRVDRPRVNKVNTIPPERRAERHFARLAGLADFVCLLEVAVA